jgi:acetate---CoA ligase (ADP-forming)
MKAFFDPDSVAVIGASADENRIGGRPVYYLNQAGYSGRVFPVNPHRTEIQGHQAYPSLREVPQRPDLAVVALPRDGVLSVVRDCVALQVPAVTIFSSGFAEVDDVGRALQASLAEAVRGTRTRILGPNTNGTMAPRRGLYACFTPLLQRGFPSPGSVAILTQSAALGTYLLDQCRERGIGIAYWAHTGNEADLDLLDVFSFAVEDDNVRMVMVTSEVLRAPQRLRRALRRAAARGVLVAVLQVGQSAVGGIAAASHTGALVGAQSTVTRGLLRQGGAVLAKSMRELVDIAEAHGRLGRLPGARVGILTPSGGIGIMLADALEGTGVDLPRFSPALQERLVAAAPFCHPGNPVDITAQIINEPARFEAVLTLMAESGELDAIISFLPVGSERDPLTRQLVAVASRARGAESPVRFGAVGTIEPAAFGLLHEAGIGIWAEPDDLRVAMAAIARAASAPLGDMAPIIPGTSGLASRLARAATAGVVGELDSKDLLRQRGLCVVPDAAVATAAAAASAADAIGYPVALKLHAPGLAHKARVGGVKLALASRAEVIAAAESILASPAATAGATLLVEPMLAGIELFVGAIATEQYGPLSLCGLGGGNVEHQGRVAYRYLPLAEADLTDMLAETGVLPLLEATGRAQTVRQHLHRIMTVLQELLIEGGGALRAVDLNPVIVGARGECTILDALFEAHEAAEAGGVTLA